MISRWARRCAEDFRTLSGSEAGGNGDRTSTRPIRSLRTRLRTMPEMRFEFGTITVERSKVCDLRRADIDAPDVCLAVAHHHEIADADRPLPQKDQPGDEIVDDRLQAETDTDRQGARRRGSDRSRLRPS